ncbi:Uncharacterized protein Rs2_42712 [Raphanus sativus]|nr:Uncharacterized protein Rs2_42712 [Raphanus sativus]
MFSNTYLCLANATKAAMYETPLTPKNASQIEQALANAAYEPAQMRTEADTTPILACLSTYKESSTSPPHNYSSICGRQMQAKPNGDTEAGMTTRAHLTICDL